MENNLENNTLNNEVQTPELQRSLCEHCFEFYGNAASDNLCSKCYKDVHQTDEFSKKRRGDHSPTIEERRARIKQLIKELREMGGESDNEAQETKEEEKQEEIIDEKPKQVDTSKCWKCPKKAGLLGYTCKCGYVFCKNHRLPEEHECDFDFVKVEREKLKKANPVVAGSKLDKI